MLISRRLVSLGGLAALCPCLSAEGATPTAANGCAFSQAADSHDSNSQYPGLRRWGAEPPELALAPIVIEMSQLFELTPVFGFYDDTGSCKGNALASSEELFPPAPNAPFKTEGTVLLGEKLFSNLNRAQYQTAAIAAVCAHEFGHLLQFKYLKSELSRIRDLDGSVVRVELFADFICGYDAGVRQFRQGDYAGAIGALNQYRSGDLVFGESHHGTPEERGHSVTAGFATGSKGPLPPERIARLAFEYISTLIPQAVHGDGC
jgi:hypothetical protein